MKRNIGKIELLIRLFGSIVFFDAAADPGTSGHWRWLYGVVAIYLIATAVVGYCPLYALLHIHTNRKSHL